MSLKSLSTGKVYKNVYTILEKVKKGEIKSYYKDDEGLFGKIDFYKKPNLVKPYLHYLDSDRLISIMETEINGSQQLGEIIKKCYTQALQDKEIKKLKEKENKDINLNEFCHQLHKVYADFPKHLQDDIFNMYYNKIENIEFEERKENNHTKYKFLERANNPVGKIMSERSHLKSAIFMKNVMLFYLTRMAILKMTNKDKYEKLSKSLKNGDEFNNKETDDLMKNDFGNGASKKMMEDLIEQASELCKKMDDVMDHETQEQMFENINEKSSEAAKLNTEYVNDVAANLNKIKMKVGCVKEKIKKLMNKSLSYFSAKKVTIHENLFDTDNISGLEDYELLHPKLRKIFAEDVSVKETKSIGKIDVYIDISGSMDQKCKVGEEKMTKLDFAKSFLAHLRQENLINNIYTFNSEIFPIKNHIINIAMIGCTGGTCIKTVVKKIIKDNQNAIVITDAEDRCDIYSDKVFFIGVVGAEFRYFSESCLESYANAGQMIVFDGNKIQSVNKNGHVIQ